MLITAYSPLGQGIIHQSKELKDIGEKYDKTGEQVALRWLVEQQNVVAIPRSSKPAHIESNADIFDFELTAEDHSIISQLPKNRRQINPEFAPDWD